MKEVLDWLPPGVEFVPDVCQADWVVKRLEPWGSSWPVRLWSFLPDGFERDSPMG